VRLLRKLHAELRDLGIPREEFKARTGCKTMKDLTNRDLVSRIRFVRWIGEQPYPARREYGAMR